MLCRDTRASLVVIQLVTEFRKASSMSRCSEPIANDNQKNASTMQNTGMMAVSANAKIDNCLVVILEGRVRLQA